MAEETSDASSERSIVDARSEALSLSAALRQGASDRRGIHHAGTAATIVAIAVIGTSSMTAIALMRAGLAPRRPASMFDRWLGVTSRRRAASASDSPSLSRSARNASGFNLTFPTLATVSNGCQGKLFQPVCTCATCENTRLGFTKPLLTVATVGLIFGARPGPNG